MNNCLTQGKWLLPFDIVKGWQIPYAIGILSHF
jgi:hypothetical protein